MFCIDFALSMDNALVKVFKAWNFKPYYNMQWAAFMP
jgi:hypothetical protein